MPLRQADVISGTVASTASSPDAGRSRFAPVFAVSVLVLSTGAFFVLRTGEDASSPAVLLLWLVAYAIAAIGLFDVLLRQRRLVRLPLPLVAFVGLALLSTTWSVAPGVSQRRGVALAGTVLVGLYLAEKLEPVELLEAVRRAALIVGVASLLLYAAGDPRALDEVHQTLRGVVATKNTLGRFMAVGLIASAAVVMLDRRRWRRSALSAAPLGLALLLTDSAGGAIIAVLGLVTIGAVALWRLDGGKSAAPAVLFAGLTMAAVLLPAGVRAGSLLALAGRDATLTGRTDIWAESIRALGDRPLTGAGYGAFWGTGSSDGSEAAARISARLAEPVANAHNGMLDIGLDLGLPGMALAALVLIAILHRGYRDALVGGLWRTGSLRVLVVLLVFVATLAEGGLLKENSLLTILLAAAAGTDPRTRHGSVDQPPAQPRTAAAPV